MDTRRSHLRPHTKRQRSLDVHATASHRAFHKRFVIVQFQAYTHVLIRLRSSEHTHHV